MPSAPDDHLRQALLAVSVLHDIDLVPLPPGVRLTDDPAVEIPWSDVAAASAGADPDSETGRALLDRWLRLARWAADGAPVEDVRPLALPVGHPLHPGAGWAYEHVLGGALDAGLAVVGADPRRPERVLALPPGVLRRAGVEPTGWVPAAQSYLQRMAEIAAERRSVAAPGEPLRPIGDCDVLTLLAARCFRSELTDKTGGMTAVAAPMRSRGWTDLRRIDPAFCGAAAAATDEVDRGFSRPLLITADEVQRAPGGHAGRIELLDPATNTRSSTRSVGYR